MERINLNSPIPRKSELNHFEFPYKIVGKKYLPTPTAPTDIPFFQVLLSRNSRRNLGYLTDNSLSELLWYSAKTLSIKKMESGYIWQHRTSPSAGGRHPIDLLLFRRGTSKVRIYDPLAHSLCEIKIESSLLDNFIESINEVISVREATIIMFAAQFDRTLSKYEYGESLVWRDAGALLATISLVAEAIGLHSCALGVTGEPLLSKLLRSNDRVVGVGGCLVGKAKLSSPK
jgi:SagB-type dehydrogenase family enzyme